MEAKRIEHSLDDNLLMANYIMQRRIYDVLMRMYAEIDEENAKTLFRIHKEGGFIGPDPSIRNEYHRPVDEE